MLIDQFEEIVDVITQRLDITKSVIMIEPYRESNLYDFELMFLIGFLDAHSLTEVKNALKEYKCEIEVFLLKGVFRVVMKVNTALPF